jgi:hypothetical protein
VTRLPSRFLKSVNCCEFRLVSLEVRFRFCDLLFKIKDSIFVTCHSFAGLGFLHLANPFQRTCPEFFSIFCPVFKDLGEVNDAPTALASLSYEQGMNQRIRENRTRRSRIDAWQR